MKSDTITTDVSLSPQCQRVLNHLEKRGSITAHEALKMYGIMRLASRISDMRKEGYDIRTEMVERYNKYAEKVYVAKYTLGKRAGVL